MDVNSLSMNSAVDSISSLENSRQSGAKTPLKHSILKKKIETKSFKPKQTKHYKKLKQ